MLGENEVMMSMESRRELAFAVSSHYEITSKSRKSQMLDEFVLSTGYNRKYAIRLLQNTAVGMPRAIKPARLRQDRRRTYGQAVEQPLLRLWVVSGGLCPKRLIPFLRELIEALERHDEINLCPVVREKLLEMSASTAERLLQRIRRSLERGVSTTLPGTLLRHQIPIRTYEDWSENRPGFMEIDLVAHCGGTAVGEYCYTLTMTDVCTGWTECFALVNRSQITVRAAIERLRKRLPFPLLGIDSDNGSEFINHHLKDWCDDQKIAFTRCRPYKKNDQCHVEQKNGAVVRPLVGYARYEGTGAAEHLNRLYIVHRNALNFFEPSMKLTGKSRVGAKVKKTYDQARTPWERLVAANLLEEGSKELLLRYFLKLNPAKLRRDIENLESGLRYFALDSPIPMRPLDTATRNVTIEGANTHAQNA